MNGRCLAVSLLALESKGSDSDSLSWGRRLDCCDSRTDVRTRRIEDVHDASRSQDAAVAFYGDRGVSCSPDRAIAGRLLD